MLLPLGTSLFTVSETGRSVTGSAAKYPAAKGGIRGIDSPKVAFVPANWNPAELRTSRAAPEGSRSQSALSFFIGLRGYGCLKNNAAALQ